MAITPWVSPDDLEHSESDLAPAAARLASRILFTLTGRMYGGEKTVTEIYHPPTQAYDMGLRALTLQQYGISLVCRSTPYELADTGETLIPLRRRPVRSIESVTVTRTGATVDPGSYTVSDSTYLKAAPSVPVLVALTVEYTYGAGPPPDGVSAARSLADELVLLFGGGPEGAECRLRNITSFSRQGVSFEIEDARGILQEGRTGIPEVDLFVASVNPTRARLRSRVLSPDSHTAR